MQNAVLSSQQKQQNVPAGHVIIKGRGCGYGLCTVAFFKWSLQARWTSTLILAKTMRFSPHTEERKLTLVRINQR